MKNSLKKFYEYLVSDEELMYYVRINVEWNEESFNQMKQLVREVIKDYENEDYYPKLFVVYFMYNIPLIINMLSHFKTCDESMIAERIKQLEELRNEFIDSLWHARYYGG